MWNTAELRIATFKICSDAKWCGELVATGTGYVNYTFVLCIGKYFRAMLPFFVVSDYVKRL